MAASERDYGQVADCNCIDEDVDFFISLTESSQESAEQFCRMKKVNISLLCERSADKCLKQRDYQSAIKFNFLAKTPQLERISNCALLGCYEEVANYVQLLFSTRCNDIRESERVHLATLAVNCFVDLYREKKEQDNHGDVLVRLAKFLEDNMYYDDRIAIRLLLSEELFELASFCAQLRTNYTCLVETLITRDNFGMSLSLTDNEIGLEASEEYLLSNDDYLNCLISPQINNAFLAKPSLTGLYLRFLTKRLPQFNMKSLKLIASCLAPRRAVVQLVMNRVLPRMQHQYLGASDYEMLTKKDFLNFYTLVLLMISQLGNCDFSEKLVVAVGQCTVAGNRTPDEVASEEEHAPHSPQTLVSAGQVHAAVIKNGVLYTWGTNSHGRLGYGTDDFQMTSTSKPSVVSFFSDNVAIAVRTVSCGAQHTLILTDFGVYSCGSSTYGQLGIGRNVRYALTPMLIEGLVNFDIKRAVSGQYHSLIVTSKGELFSFGWGIHGQLGLGSIENFSTPTKVTEFDGIQIVDVAGGYCHSLALDSTGVVYTFGNGIFGQTGLGSCNKCSVPQPLTLITEPVDLISTSYFHNVVRTVSNRLFCWGAHPQTVRLIAHSAKKARAKEVEATAASGAEEVPPANYVDHLSPQELNLQNIASNVIQIRTGATHSMLLTSDGKLFTWGRGMDAQLGHGSKKEVKLPTQVVFLKKIVSIATGYDFSLAVDDSDQIWAWGQNSAGQLGFQSEAKSGRKEIKLKTSRNVITVPGSKCIQSEPARIILPESNSALYYESLNYSIDIRAMKNCDKRAPSPESEKLQDFRLVNCESSQLDDTDLAQLLVQYKGDLDLTAVLKRCEALKAYQYAAMTHEIRGHVDRSLESHLKSINLSLPTEHFSHQIKFVVSYHLKKTLHEPSSLRTVGVFFEYCSRHHNVIDVSQIVLDLCRHDIRDYVFGVLVLQYLSKNSDKLNLSLKPTFLLDLVLETLQLLDANDRSDSLMSAAVIELISSDQSLLFPAEQMWQSILKNINEGVKTLSDIDESVSSQSTF